MKAGNSRELIENIYPVLIIGRDNMVLYPLCLVTIFCNMNYWFYVLLAERLAVNW